MSSFEASLSSLRTKVSQNYANSISKYLCNQLDFTARRTFYEDHEFENYMLGKVNKHYGPDNDTVIDFSDYAVDKISELNEFRLQNWSECIDPGNQRLHKRTDHICLHRFRMNGRHFVEAKATDERGRSVCSMCQQMANFKDVNHVFDSAKYRKYLMLDGQVNEESVKAVQAPVGVESRPVMVLEVKADSKELTEDLRQKLRKLHEPPENSLALRFQRQRRARNDNKF
jgi:hypothetical protein